MIGVPIFGVLADRIGRKPTIVLGTAAFGLGTLATLLAQDIISLLPSIRFLTGIGLGGALPNTIALMTELCHRRRATMVMAMFVGFSVGSALSGLIAAALIPIFGWRSIFSIGGIAPFLLVPFLATGLPESVRFLALSGHADARVAELLKRVAPSARFPATMRFEVHDEARGPAGRPSLQRASRLRDAPAVDSFLMSLLDLYLLLNWLPT